jgi:hypothetical protein
MEEQQHVLETPLVTAEHVELLRTQHFFIIRLAQSHSGVISEFYASLAEYFALDTAQKEALGPFRRMDGQVW